MLNAQGAHVEEAKRYVQRLWINNTADQRDFCLSYGFHVPARSGVARSALPLQAPVPAAAVQNLNANGHFLPPIWNAAMGTALTDAVTNILQKQRPVADEVAAAARKCERELSRSLEG